MVSATAAYGGQLLLVEDFPNALYRDPTLLHAIVRYVVYIYVCYFVVSYHIVKCYGQVCGIISPIYSSHTDLTDPSLLDAIVWSVVLPLLFIHSMPTIAKLSEPTPIAEFCKYKCLFILLYHSF